MGEELVEAYRGLSLRVDGRNLLVVRIVYGDLEQEGRFDPLYNYGVVVGPPDTGSSWGALGSRWRSSRT